MQIRHSIPDTELEDHCRDHQCPCDPDQTSSTAPGKRVVVTLTHHALPRSKP